MYVHLDRKQLTEWLEHSDYMLVLSALLIGFIVAWNIVQPDFISKTTPTRTNAGMIARSLPVDSLHGSAKLAPIDQVETIPEKYFAPTSEVNAAHPLPQVFVKVQEVDNEYLIHVGTNNLVINTTNFKKVSVGGEGHFLLRVNGEDVTEFFVSPLYLNQKWLSVEENVVQIVLVDNMGRPLSHQGNLISETISLIP